MNFVMNCIHNFLFGISDNNHGEDRIANKNDTSKDKDGDTEIELLNVSEGDKNDNSKDAIDAANSESKHKSDSPPLLPGSHPTMDFSGTINYI